MAGKMKELLLLVVVLLNAPHELFAGNMLNAKEPVDSCNKPEFCSTGTMAANPDDCKTYYLCVNGNWMKMNCSEGTYFDSVTQNCTFKAEAVCLVCPPFTGTTRSPTTLEPGLCENITQCVELMKYPDRSNCRAYYLCSAGNLLHRDCSSGLVFDIYKSDCIEPFNGFDCYYRCLTPAPTTIDFTTSMTHISSSNNPIDNSPDIGLIIGLIVGIILVIVTIIIIIVCCLKKHNKNKVDPEQDVLQDELSANKDREEDLQHGVDSKTQPDLLHPAIIVEEKPCDFNHEAFILQAEKEKKKGLKQFKRKEPSQEEAMKAAIKYKRKLRKQLQMRYEAEKKQENTSYDDKIAALNRNALVIIESFRGNLRLAAKRNDPTELTALANNHVNSHSSIQNARQKVLDDRDATLRERLKAMHLTEEQMVKAGLLVSDLNGSDVAIRIKRMQKEQETLKETFLQEFASRVASGASLTELETITQNYESQLQNLQDSYLQERGQATQRLQQALGYLAVQNLDSIWKQECQKVDEAYEYSESDPAAVKTTLVKHLEALKMAGEEVDLHFTSKKHQTEKLEQSSTKLTTEDSKVKEPASTTPGLFTAAALAEGVKKTDFQKANENGKLTDETDSKKAPGAKDLGESAKEPSTATPEWLYMSLGRAKTLDADNLEEEQMKILAKLKELEENAKAMKTSERSKMDELLRKRLNERRTEINSTARD